MVWYCMTAVCHSVGGVGSSNAGGIARRLHPPAHPEVLGRARRDPPDLPPDHGDQVRARFARLFVMANANGVVRWVCRVLTTRALYE